MPSVLPVVILREPVGALVRVPPLGREVAEACRPWGRRRLPKQIHTGRCLRKLIKGNLFIPVRPEHDIGHNGKDTPRLQRGLRRVHRCLLCGYEGRLDLAGQLLGRAEARRLAVKLLFRGLATCGEALALCEDVIRNQLWQLEAKGLSVPRLRVLSEALPLSLDVPHRLRDVVIAEELRILRWKRWGHRAAGRQLTIGARVD
mmetsp:Transcript_129800/g.277032  ORF Transcript_129800/g.277032 Transcript_129800/m.277032 type:complete len:202 (+) Transcript_129800:496-1101(+)